MANCNDFFHHYNSIIKLSDEKRELLLKARDGLRARMENIFTTFSVEVTTGQKLEFQSQGSFVMDTIITPEKEDFDLDDGVYFLGNLTDAIRPKPKYFHDLVLKSVDRDNEYEDILDKETCVRVKYKKGFHIDLPIYYSNNFKDPSLAHLQKGWVLSNPVEFIYWFEEKTKSGFKKEFLYESKLFSDQYNTWAKESRKIDCQLRRIVRYLKAWADLKRKEMPCGVEMTILAATNFVENIREDISLRDTIVKIKEYLITNNCQCPRPTTPEGEDLFEYKTLQEKQYFLKSLDELINSANKAIDIPSQKEAAFQWKRNFGPRFPTELTSAEKNPIKDLAALHLIASKSKPYLS